MNPVLTGIMASVSELGTTIANRLSALTTWWIDVGWPHVAGPVGRYVGASLLGSVALTMLLPGGSLQRGSRSVAVVLFGAAAGILLFAFEGHDVVSLVQCLLWFLSVVTIFAALAMVTSRRPVYAAIWFALTLLGVGGLMFLAGAQFLGVATVAVYAGAIVVTFLFVLMLAQPSGDAFYDRMSWSVFRRWLASLAGMAMASLLAWTARMVVTASEPSAGPANASAGLGQAEHVAALGGQLFSKYLVEIQVAGVLLLVALVGAIAMAAQRVAKHDIAARLDEALRVAKGRGGTYRG